jgi:hypothetical protein
MRRLSAAQLATASAILFSFKAAFAQTTVAPPTPPHLVGSIAGHPGWPVAKPVDVNSPDAILNAVYSVISGPQGQPRDWHRIRSLFIPFARGINSFQLLKDGDRYWIVNIFWDAESSDHPIPAHYLPPSHESHGLCRPSFAAS